MSDQVLKAYEDIEQSEKLKSCLNQYLSVIVDLFNEGFKDPLGLAKAEVFLAKYSCFNHSIAINSHLIKQLNEQLTKFSKKQQRSVDVCARDIWKYYRDDIVDLFGCAMHHHRFDNIIDYYITFKKEINNVSPEVAKEIDDMVNMSDDEFNASLTDDEDDDIFISEYDIPDKKLYSEE